jgi:sugar (pentulose or hexulose) kinase
LFLNWLKDLFQITSEEFDAVSKRKANDAENGQYEASSVYVNTALLGEKGLAGRPRGGTLANLTITTMRDDLFQAALETLAFEAWRRMEQLSATCHPKPSRILLVGGFSRNPAFLILRASLAKTSDAPTNIYTVDDEYVGCRGAAMCGACAVGVFSNLTEATRAMTARSHPIYGFVDLGHKIRSTQQELIGT